MSVYTEDRNVIVVYLKNDLMFEDLIPSMKEYIARRFDIDNSSDVKLKEMVYNAVGKLKNIFDEVYKAGMTMYSDIHGKLEIDILAHALEPFYIKTGYIKSDDKVIIVITDEDIIRSETMYNKKLIYNEDLINEIEIYMNIKNGE